MKNWNKRRMLKLFWQGSYLWRGHNLLRVAWRAPHGRGRNRPALPLRRLTRDRCPLASVMLHNNTLLIHLALITLLSLSSFMYATCTFAGSGDIIYCTLENKINSLFTHKTHHSHDRPPNCGERTDDNPRTRSGIFGRSASYRLQICFGKKLFYAKLS